MAIVSPSHIPHDEQTITPCLDRCGSFTDCLARKLRVQDYLVGGVDGKISWLFRSLNTKIAGIEKRLNLTAPLIHLPPSTLIIEECTKVAPTEYAYRNKINTINTQTRVLDADNIKMRAYIRDFSSRLANIVNKL